MCMSLQENKKKQMRQGKVIYLYGAIGTFTFLQLSVLHRRKIQTEKDTQQKFLQQLEGLKVQKYILKDKNRHKNIGVTILVNAV